MSAFGARTGRAMRVGLCESGYVSSSIARRIRQQIHCLEDLARIANRPKSLARFRQREWHQVHCNHLLGHGHTLDGLRQHAALAGSVADSMLEQLSSPRTTCRPGCHDRKARRTGGISWRLDGWRRQAPRLRSRLHRRGAGVAAHTDCRRAAAVHGFPVSARSRSLQSRVHDLQKFDRAILPPRRAWTVAIRVPPKSAIVLMTRDLARDLK